MKDLKNCISILRWGTISICLVCFACSAYSPNLHKLEPYYTHREAISHPVKAASGTVRILDKREAVIHMVIVLEEGWDLFGFSRAAGPGSFNRVNLSLPDCFELDGKLKVISPALRDSKYFEGGPVSRYTGVVELTQKVKILGSESDFKNLVVGGNFYLQVHRLDPPNSIPFAIPFVAFCTSSDSEIAIWDRRTPHAVEWSKNKAPGKAKHENRDRSKEQE